MNFNSVSSLTLAFVFPVICPTAYGATPLSGHTSSAKVSSGADVPQDWWGKVQEEIRRSEYHVTWQDKTSATDLPAAFQAPNRAHNLRTYFTPEGVRVVPRTNDAPGWKWGLRLTGWGRQGNLLTPDRATPTANGNRVEYRRGDLTEWYVNDSRGLEQGFTITAAPPGQRVSVSPSLPSALQTHSDMSLLQTRMLGPIAAKLITAPKPIGLTDITSREAMLAEAQPSRLCQPLPPMGGLRIELAITGNLHGALGADTRSVEFLTADGARVLSFRKLQASDARGRTLPAEFDLADGRLALVVDDAEAAYPVIVDPLVIGTPEWTAEGNQALAYFGTSVAAAGDVNGDGYGDVIVGADYYDNGQKEEGRAFVYHGGPSGLSSSANWTAEGNQESALFGCSVATAGDVNGDGYGDVIVGAKVYDNDQLGEGRAFLYAGSISGLNSTANWILESNQSGAYFGRSVATAGDVNSDGYDDVIVGAPGYDNGQPDEGKAFLYHGSAAGPNATPNWTAEGNQANAAFGASVATAGDVNGDGYADIIVGAYGYSGGGRAFLYLGSPTGLSPVANWTAQGNQSGGCFGYSVATAGDVNRDGYSDVIVGARQSENGETNEGRAFVYYGSASGPGVSANWTAESNQAEAWFGSSVGAAGDVNGDGYSDVAIGSYQYDNGETDEGAAFVYYGSDTGLSATADWTCEGDQPGAYFGYSVSTAGDVNGDGYADIIVGAQHYSNGQSQEGQVSVYHGSCFGLSGGTGWTAEGNQAQAGFGCSVGTAGDVNGDGFSDVIVGAQSFDNGQANEGKVFVYQGSVSGYHPTADWTAESDQANAYFGCSVSTAGDVNGDGYSDVIVGAYGYDNGQTDEGRAFVYHGAASGLSSTANWISESNSYGAAFGCSVAVAGDVNGDGYSDVVVGAESYSSNYGRAYVYHGRATGLLGSPARILDGTPSARFGHAVATAGDVNGDGYSDVIVGESSSSGYGHAYVYHGSASGLGTGPSWTGQGSQAGALFGSSVATAGDVNGDGYSDVIVGTPGYDNGEIDEGLATVYYGGSHGIIQPYPPYNVSLLEGNQSGAQFGFSVATAGDVNGDGYGDVIVGAPQYDNGETDEGRAFIYYGCQAAGTPAGLSARQNWTEESNQTGAQFGTSVGLAGDVNGDGYSDIIVGAVLYDSGQTDEGWAFIYHGSSSGGLSLTANSTAYSTETDGVGYSVGTAGDVNGDGHNDVIVTACSDGRVFVYHGSASGINATPSWTAQSDQEYSRFGCSAATAGDVNGDGYSDVIVGADQYDNGHTDEGRAFVYYGSASGLSLTANWVAEGNQNNAFFGFSLATAGDVNGDGYGDVIVGAYGYDNQEVGEGRAFVYYGAASGLPASAGWTAEINQHWAQFGRSVATVGDVNGDGYSDVIVGADQYSNGQVYEGGAWVYFGSAVGLSSAPAWHSESDQAHAYFGYSAATAGDVNGDGYGDVIIGAYRYDHGEQDEGRALVYHGSASGLSTTASWTAESDQSGARFGWSVATAGDVNGDGYSDVVVGAPYYANPNIYEGRSCVYYGSPDGLNLVVDWSLEGNQDRAHFGCSAATAGDVNADGYSDVIVGAYGYDNGSTDGRAFVYCGNSGIGLSVKPQQRQADDSAPIAILGRSNSTSSFRLAASGRTPFGRGKTKLEWEVKRLGAAFDGTGLQRSAGWSDTGIAGTPLNELVSDLTTNQPYHWRLRLVYSLVTTPYENHSRWVGAPLNGRQEADLWLAADTDSDGVVDPADNCPTEPNPGQENADRDAAGDVCDGCPADGAKVVPGICGCGAADIDTDTDGTADCNDRCPGDPAKVAPGQCGCGISDTDTDGDGTPNCNDSCPNDPNKTAPGACGCGVTDTDTDSDGALDCNDGCPGDAGKTSPGQCGCGALEDDTDSDGTADCNDQCPGDRGKVVPGQCGCDHPDTDSDSDAMADCVDGCPADANKVLPGICGCGIADADSDSDGTADCLDGCSVDPGKTNPGVCGCGVADIDTDADGVPDCNDKCPGNPDTDRDSDGVLNCLDGCPDDPGKTASGVCGCGLPDIDADTDGTPDCHDACPTDSLKTVTGQCGCSHPDTDSDIDGLADCVDGCPTDAGKTAPGDCGCGLADTDSDGDHTADCVDGCPTDAHKTAPGACGCGTEDTDTDRDLVPDCHDGCPADKNKSEPGICGCGLADRDGDADGTADCNDRCPNDVKKTAPGACGCGAVDTDSDHDGVANCSDGCPADSTKNAPGTCGCGIADTDGDGDLIADCREGCPADANKTAPGACGCGIADTDTDRDFTPDCRDGCTADAAKTAPGICGCGVPDTDRDRDGTPDCDDNCSDDPQKTEPGTCGCGHPEVENCSQSAAPSETPPDQQSDAAGSPRPAVGFCGAGLAEAAILSLGVLGVIRLRQRGKP